MVRRLKSEVLTELPAKTRALIPFKAPAHLLAANARWMNEHDDTDEAIAAEVEVERVDAVRRYSGRVGVRERVRV
jgi:hypothetical protein